MVTQLIVWLWLVAATVGLYFAVSNMRYSYKGLKAVKESEKNGSLELLAISGFRQDILLLVAVALALILGLIAVADLPAGFVIVPGLLFFLVLVVSGIVLRTMERKQQERFLDGS